MPTPLTQNGDVDRATLARLFEHLLSASVDGLVLLGTSGEGMALDNRKRTEVLRASAQFRGETTLIVGCAGNSTESVLTQIEAAADHGADAALVPPPYYYPMSADALVAFYADIEEASPVPIILYHIPARTKNSLSLASVRELAQLPRVAGIKDSDGAAIFHLELLEASGPNFAVLQGAAPLLLWSYMLGGQGAITPVSALFPQLELGLRAALDASDLPSAQRYGKGLCAAARLLRVGGLPLVSNLKAVSALIGFGEPWTTPPLPAADEQQLHRLRTSLAEVQQWLGEPAA